MPKNYSDTQGATGEYEKLELGGQVCKIIGAKEETSSKGNKMLVVAFDIAEGEQKDFFNRRFEELKQFNADAKWPNGAIHRLMLEDTEGNCNKFFKGFITSVEASNKGYNFETSKYDEKTLKGKLFGGIFGREQYLGQMGEIKISTKLRFIRAADKAKGAEIPEDKLLPGQPSLTNAGGEYITIDDNADLPF